MLGFVVDNSNKVPAAVAPGHACGTPTAGTHLTSFNVDVTVTGPHAKSVGTVTGAYGY